MNQSAAAERGVTIGSVLLRVADVLSSLSPAQWESPSLCEGWRVKDVAGHVLVRVGSSFPQLLSAAGRVWLQDPVKSPVKVLDELSYRAAAAHYDRIVEELRQIATERSTGTGRTGTGDLIESVVHGFDMTNPLGIDLGIAPSITSTVAQGAAFLPFGKAARVLRERTLVATDAGWRLGNGPEIEGTAEAIVLYLYGRKPLPA